MLHHQSRFHYSFAFVTLICLFVTASCTNITITKDGINDIPLTDIGDYQYSWSPNGDYILLNWPEINLLNYGQPVDGPIAWFDMSSGTMKYLERWGYAPLWSPDSSVILFNTGNHHTGNYQSYLFHLATQREVILPPLPGTPVSWLTNGIYYETNSGLWRINLNWAEIVTEFGRNPTWTTPHQVLAYSEAEQHEPRIVSLAPDGQSAALWDYRPGVTTGALKIVSLDGQNNTIEDLSPDTMGMCCSWSPDSKKFAFSSFEPEYGLYVIDFTDKQRKQIVSTDDMGEGRILSMDFSPDSQRIIFEWSTMVNNPFDDTQIYLTDIRNHQLLRLTESGSDAHNHVQWSPNGKQISFRRNISNSPVWIANMFPSAKLNFTTVSVDFPPSHLMATSSETSKEIAGIAVAYTGQCPSQIFNPLIDSFFDRRPGLIAIPITNEVSEEEIDKWDALSDLPLRRISKEIVNSNSSFGLFRRQDPALIYYSVVYGKDYYLDPPLLSLEAATLSDNGSITIHSVSEELESEDSVICFRPQVITIGGIKTLLIQHQAEPQSIVPVANSLLWIENNSWWRLSALSPESGGRYSADDLIGIVRSRLQEYDAQGGKWKPVVIE